MTILSLVLAILLAIALVQIASQSQEIGDLERSQMRLERRIEEADEELQMMRCEYERSMGGRAYKWRPVNRISQRFPR